MIIRMTIHGNLWLIWSISLKIYFLMKKHMHNKYIIFKNHGENFTKKKKLDFRFKLSIFKKCRKKWKVGKIKLKRLIMRAQKKSKQIVEFVVEEKLSLKKNCKKNNNWNNKKFKKILINSLLLVKKISPKKEEESQKLSQKHLLNFHK